ncbi:MAG TPA: 2Fe-2S iron-sulfur cluster-binding protein [Steroidobacteraceae bacterium]|nr:2Fe-2S iron-sulfur cluster-binding protein [Steroidobacteraceae bacterium]
MHLNPGATSVAFAADGGIVSALPVIRQLLEGRPTERVLMFYGTSGEEHAEPLEELLAMKDRHLGRLSLGFVMAREPDETDLLTGRLDAAKVGAIASKLLDPLSVRQYFICGSQQMIADVSGALHDIGVESSRIQLHDTAGAGVAAHGVPTGTAEAKGTPAPSSSPSTSPAANETSVVVVMDGRRRTFSMITGQESILDAADRAGVDLPFSCKAGVCSTCRTKLVRGEVELAQNYALEDWELEQGFILACQAHAKTPEIELTYDEK